MGYRKSMQRRWIAGLVLVGAASAGLYLATRGGDRASSAPEPGAAGEAPQRQAPPKRVGAPARVTPPGRKRIPLDLGKGDPSPQIKKWKEDGLPGTFREAVAPDDSQHAEQELAYKMRRMRFELTDTAATCYRGDDGHEELTLAYELVVADGVLSIENVRMLSSTLSDKQLESCILDRLGKLHVPADDIPDVRQASKTTIDQSSMAAANRRAMRE